MVTMSNDLWIPAAEKIVMPRIDPGHNGRIVSVTLMRMLKALSRARVGRGVVAGVALATLIACGASLAAMPRAEKHEIRHQIEKLEDAWRNAVLHGNSSAMDALLADDYMAITPTGILQSKEQALASLRGGTIHFNSLALSDRKIRLYGNTAIVTSRAEVTGTSPDGNMVGNYRYTRVYVKDAKGVWRIVSFEASKIRQPGEQH